MATLLQKRRVESKKKKMKEKRKKEEKIEKSRLPMEPKTEKSHGGIS